MPVISCPAEFRPAFVLAGSFSMMNIVEYSGDIMLLRVRVRPASGWGVNSWLMRSTVDHCSHSTSYEAHYRCKNL
jgi:hypothetical protein